MFRYNIIFVIALFSLPLAAQETTGAAGTTAPVAVMSGSSDDGIRLGLKASPNLSWLRTDEKELESDGTRLGFSWGIVADFPFGGRGNYALHTGILYTSIGGRFKADFEAAGVQSSAAYDVSINYLEIPLSLKLRGAANGDFGFYGLVGMTGATKLKARADGEATVTSAGSAVVTEFEKENVTSDIAVFKLGLQVGAGGEYQLSDLTIFGGLTFNSGLTNILDKSAKKLVDENDKKKILADYLEFTIGVYL